MTFGNRRIGEGQHIADDGERTWCQPCRIYKCNRIKLRWQGNGVGDIACSKAVGGMPQHNRECCGITSVVRRRIGGGNCDQRRFFDINIFGVGVAASRVIGPRQVGPVINGIVAARRSCIIGNRDAIGDFNSFSDGIVGIGIQNCAEVPSETSGGYARRAGGKTQIHT